MFGRGGEEAIALKRAGVPFRVVPGITAAIGGLAYAGIPATHRDVNHSFAFVSGHGAGGSLPGEVDWQALSRAAPTIVVYMAMGHLADVAQRLIAAGRGSDEPAAIVSKATMPEQSVVETHARARGRRCRLGADRSAGNAGGRPGGEITARDTVAHKFRAHWHCRLHRRTGRDPGRLRVSPAFDRRAGAGRHRRRLHSSSTRTARRGTTAISAAS